MELGALRPRNGMSVQGTEDDVGAMETEPPLFVAPSSVQVKGDWIHADGAVAIALAVANRQRARSIMQVPLLEDECLGDAQSSSIEDGEEHAVRAHGGGPGLLRSEHLGWEGLPCMSRRHPGG